MRAFPRFLWLPFITLAAAGLLLFPVPTQGRPGFPRDAWLASRPAALPPVRMGGIAFSPDGRTVACLDGINGPMASIDLRDSASGVKRKTIPVPSTTLHWLAYLPDGRLFVAGEGSGGNSALWEVRGDEAPRIALPPANGAGSILGLSPDGRTVALATNQEVLLSDLSTGKSRSFPTPRAGYPSQMAFAPDGRTLAVAGSVGISLWDLATGTLRRRITGLPWFVQTLTFSPDGRTLIYTLNNGGGGVFRVDAVTGRPLPPLVGHRGVVPDVLFSGDGKWIISCGWGDKTVRVWEARSGRLLRVLAGPLPRTTQEKDPETGRVLGEATSPAYKITALALSPDGRSLVGASGGDMLLWDLASGQPRGRSLPPPGFVGGAALSADGKSLYSAHLNGVLVRWSVPGEAQTRAALPGLSTSEAVAASPDGKIVAVGCGDAVLLWDSALNRQIGALPVRESVDTALAFSPDSRTLAVTSRGDVQLWDVTSSTLLRTLPSKPRAVTDAAYAPDGLTVAAIDSVGIVRLWDVGSGKVRWQRQAHHGSGWAVAFSPDGRFLASGGGDGAVRFWHSADGTAAGLPLLFSPIHDGNTGSLRPDDVLSIAFSRDGKELAAVAAYGQLRLWAARSRREVQSLQLQAQVRAYLAFSPDGRTLLVTSFSGMQIYDVQTGIFRPLFAATGG